MGRKKIVWLIVFAGLLFVFSSCHPRHVSDIKRDMTKAQVASLWGRTDLITDRSLNGKTVETWEYHFTNSGSICWVNFSEDRVVSTQCRPARPRGYYYSYSEPNRPVPPPTEQRLLRQGSLAMELAQALKIGPVKNEAEAASSLASLDIAPHNGWISNSDVTPEVIDELHKAVAAAADSGKLAMSREEALKTFEDLIVSIENQSAKSVPPPVKEPYPAPYSYPGAYAYPYPYPYNYPYPYYYGGFYGAFRPYYYNFRYHRRW